MPLVKDAENLFMGKLGGRAEIARTNQTADDSTRCSSAQEDNLPMTELATIKKQLPMLGLDDWDEIRKVEATLEAYRKYASQDRDLRDKSLQIGEATVRLKWHKGRILSEMEKSEGGRPETGSTVLPVNDTPTYADLGINGNTMLPFG